MSNHRVRGLRRLLTPSPLTGAFLTRLFESESDTGSHDVKATFIWMLAALAAPGVVLPILLLGWDWSFIGLKFGTDVLHQISRADRILYIGLTMAATGAISAIVWNRLLIDRRDALVLGSLPVRPSTIVRAKMLSVAIYVCSIGLAMHLLASITFGTLLSAGTFGDVMAGSMAHFVATFLGSLFTFLCVTSTLAVLTLTMSPRLVARASAVLQMAVVAAVLLLSVSLPRVSSTITTELGDARAYRSRWEFRIDPGLDAVARRHARLSEQLTWLPPVWFVGLDESLRGDGNAHLRELAGRAVMAVGVTLAISLIGLPLAYRRLMVSSVELGDLSTAGGPRRSRAESFARRMSRVPLEAGIAHFLLTATGRVARHRLVLSASLGACLAWTIPALLHGGSAFTSSAEMRVAALAVPFWIVFWITAGLRVAAALPTDLRARWIFDVTPASAAHCKSAVRRLYWTMVVLPAALLAAALSAWRIGPGPGLALGASVAAAGTLVVEVFLLGIEAVPCSRPWPAARSALRRYWPLYLVTFALVSTLPAAFLVHAPRVAFVLGMLFVGAAAGIALVGRRMDETEPPERSPDQAAFQVLGIE